jgi:amidase
MECRRRLIIALETFLSGYDAWLCPVVTIPAFEHTEPNVPGDPLPVDDQMLPYWTATISYTCPFNLTSSPVVVIPMGESHDSLPIGVQIVGRRWDDMALLNVAEALTEIAGPFRRPPGF